jgi:arylsulfatase A-like enzyme
MRQILVTLILISGLAAASASAETRNLILFVPDGLRAQMVTPVTAPAMAAIRDQGVNFQNPHAMFPTFTMPNASAMATGHYLGDTGVFGNTLYAGYGVAPANGSVTPFIENDAVLVDVDEHYQGNMLDEDAILGLARQAGFSTAAIGKVGPALVFDHQDHSGAPTIVIDDATGSPSGIPLSDEIAASLQKAGLPLAPPPRGENGKTGDLNNPGTLAANTVQQDFFADAAVKAVLPLFKARGKPFVLVFWSRDPDGAQHNQGDSLGQFTPGINGPTSLAAIKNADNDLARLEAALADLGLAGNTDIVVSADHGFSTISKESKTSPAARGQYSDVPAGHLPAGFVAIDIAQALKLPLFDPGVQGAAVDANHHPKSGNGLIGHDPAKPDVVVAANGGSDLIYLPGHDKRLAARVIAALLAQDYVSGLFVDQSLGRFPGTLPLSAINLKGSALTPEPAIFVSFRSFDTGCPRPATCAVEVADTPLQQGQGMHGSFSRADTMNFMAAIGPDFKSGFADPAPVSNADIGKTLASILGLKAQDKGVLVGRVMAEALPGGLMPHAAARTVVSAPGAGGLETVLVEQMVGSTLYFDAAGFAGRAVGLNPSSTHTAAAQ